jgi:two-component system sensor histidine kinase AgrC
LLGYIDNGDTEGLKEYFNKNISRITANLKLSNSSLGRLQNIKIPELKGVLLVKLIHAQELGLNVHIEVYDEISSVDFDLVDLCRIVGILFDNAIEAYDVGAGINNYKLRFGAIKKEASTQLIFENTITEPLPMAQIFSKGYTTKPEGQGLGLHILKQVIDKHSNADMLAESKNGLFSVIIDINQLQ